MRKPQLLKIIPTSATKNTTSFRKIRIAFNIVTGFSVFTFFSIGYFLNWNANIAVYKMYTPVATKNGIVDFALPICNPTSGPIATPTLIAP